MVYVLFLFLFIKPGVREVYEETNLLGIVEGSLGSAVTAKIERTPLFLSNVPTGTNNIEIPFSLLSNPEADQWAVVYPNYSFLKTDFGGETLQISQLYIEPDKSEIVLWILNSSDFSYGQYATAVTCDATNPCLFAGIDFAASYGIVELIEGASLQHISALSSQNSEELKSAWGYPSSAGMNITLIQSSQYNYTLLDILFQIGESPAQGIGKIAVKEWRMWMLESSSLLKPLIINARVWKK